MIDEIYIQHIEHLNISEYVVKKLKDSFIFYIGDLASFTKEELKSHADDHGVLIGRCALKEIEDAMGCIGLRLGVTIKGWPENGLLGSPLEYWRNQPEEYWED